MFGPPSSLFYKRCNVLSGTAFTIWCGSSKGTPGLGVVFLCVCARACVLQIQCHTHTHTNTHTLIFQAVALHIISHTLCVPDSGRANAEAANTHTHTHTHTLREQGLEFVNFLPSEEFGSVSLSLIGSVDRQNVQRSSSSLLFREYLSRILRDSFSSSFAPLPDVSLIQSHACLYPHTGHGIVQWARAGICCKSSVVFEEVIRQVWCSTVCILCQHSNFYSVVG